MHIVQTPPRFHPSLGGVESYVHEISSKLVEFGHDVTVLCSGEGLKPRRTREDFVDGIRVQRLSSLARIANTNITPTLPIALRNVLRTADVVHTHLPTPWSADVSAALGDLTGVPTVLTYHNDIVGTGIHDYVARVYNHTLERYTLSSADRIVVTQPAYLSYSTSVSRHEDKVRIVPNCVDTEAFAPDASADFDTSLFDGWSREGSSEARTLFFLSVLDAYHQYKGLSVLLDAMALLAESDEPCPMLLVGGTGERKPMYERQVQELGLSDHVKFIGFVPDEQLPPLYSHADLFVLPSTSSAQEGFGIVLLEAMACETPVIATDAVGVADDVWRDDLGRIVERNDPHALADAITDLLMSADLEAMGARARAACIEKYSAEECGRRIEALYDELRND
jgi:glycosyltransferase involved in cell wall biosynthesis